MFALRAVATFPPHVSVCHGIEVTSAFLQMYNGGWLSKLSQFEEACEYEIRRRGHPEQRTRFQSVAPLLFMVLGFVINPTKKVFEIYFVY